MSKAVIFSDLHIHNYKQFNKGQNRLQNCLKVLMDLGAFCTQYNIPYILFVGDLYDTQKALLTEVVNSTVDTFVTFSQEYPDIKIIAISGNHDHSTKNLFDKPAETALQHIAAIIPDTFILIDNDVYEGEGFTVSGIPYYEYPEHFDKALSMSKSSAEERGFPNEKNYLLIHQTPKGLDNAMIPFDCNPADPRFGFFDHTFCGHIHKRKEILSNFTIVGSPIHRDMSDVGQTKGFYVMNLLKPEKGLKFCPLAGYPEFVEVFEEEMTEELEESGNFVMVKPRMESFASTSIEEIENFDTNLGAEDLIRNYWQSVDGKDEELLSIGLNFLK